MKLGEQTSAPPPGVPTVGLTSLLDIGVQLRDREARVSLKLESENPYGSIKDRTAAAMLADLARRGLLRADTRVVESSSGNLAVG